MSNHAQKSLLSLNDAVSYANHATGIVKQYPDISTGKAAECRYLGILPLQEAGAMTV